MSTPSIRTANRHRAAGVRDVETFGERHRLSGIGMSCFDGSGFAVKGGGVFLERKKLYPTEGPWIIVGFLPDDVVSGDTEIRNNTAHPHASSMGYWYRVRNITGGGQSDEQPLEPVRVDFDSGGNLISGGLPHRPRDLSAKPLGGGAFELEFFYRRWGQGADPTHFRAYAGAPVNYGAPLTEQRISSTDLPFDGEGRYTFETVTYPDATKIRFAVRSSNANGEELNEYVTELVTAFASGPSQPSYFLQHAEITGGGGDSF